LREFVNSARREARDRASLLPTSDLGRSPPKSLQQDVYEECLDKLTEIERDDLYNMLERMLRPLAAKRFPRPQGWQRRQIR
jgi:hypothetical protein